MVFRGIRLPTVLGTSAGTRLMNWSVWQHSAALFSSHRVLFQAPVTHWGGSVADAPTPSGPIGGIPGAWRRKPGAKAQVLIDLTLADSLANLRFMCASPHGPPSPEAFHRVLRHITTAADLEALTKALAVARRAATRFDEQTASLLVDAALRAGQPSYALDVFRRANELRVFPSPAAFEKLLLAIISSSAPSSGSTVSASAATSELLASVARAMWLTRLSPMAAVNLGGLICAAYAVLGDLPAALKAYAAFRVLQLKHREASAGLPPRAPGSRAGRPDARPLLHLARALRSGVVPPNVLIENADAVRALAADARADCPDRPAVLAAASEVEAQLPRHAGDAAPTEATS